MGIVVGQIGAPDVETAVGAVGAAGIVGLAPLPVGCGGAVQTDATADKASVVFFKALVPVEAAGRVDHAVDRDFDRSQGRRVGDGGGVGDGALGGRCHGEGHSDGGISGHRAAPQHGVQRVAVGGRRDDAGEGGTGRDGVHQRGVVGCHKAGVADVDGVSEHLAHFCLIVCRLFRCGEIGLGPLDRHIVNVPFVGPIAHVAEGDVDVLASVGAQINGLLLPRILGASA